MVMCVNPPPGSCGLWIRMVEWRNWELWVLDAWLGGWVVLGESDKRSYWGGFIWGWRRG